MAGLNVYSGVLHNKPEKREMKYLNDDKILDVCTGKIAIKVGDIFVEIPYIAKGEVVFDLCESLQDEEIHFIAEMNLLRENVEGVVIRVPGLQIIKVDKNKKLLQLQEDLLAGKC